MASPAPLRASPLQPKDWIVAGLAQLARQGIESVRIEVLARELAVSKGSFYWHFQDRDDLLTRMASHWEEQEAAWLSAEEAGAGDAPNAAARWVRFVERSVEPDRIHVEIAIRAWARKDERMAARVTDIEARKARVIAGVLADIGFTREASDRWSEMVTLVYLGWLDRTARGPALGARGLGELLSDLILAASAKSASANS
jgi:AcrR family transcriptional regulator